MDSEQVYIARVDEVLSRTGRRGLMKDPEEPLPRLDAL
jgi:ribosomal protein S28E/S33